MEKKRFVDFGEAENENDLNDIDLSEYDFDEIMRNQEGTGDEEESKEMNEAEVEPKRHSQRTQNPKKKAKSKKQPVFEIEENEDGVSQDYRDKSIRIYVTDEIYNSLKLIAFFSHKTVSVLVNDLLKDSLTKEFRELKESGMLKRYLKKEL